MRIKAWHFWGALITIGVIYLVVQTSQLWRSLLVAALLAYLLHPAVNRLEKRGYSRLVAAGIVYGFCLAILIGIIYLAGALIIGRVPNWVNELEVALLELRQLAERPFRIWGVIIEPDRLIAYGQRILTNAANTVPVGPSQVVGGITDNLIWLLVIFIGFYYLLRDGWQIVPALISLLPQEWQEDATLLSRELDNVWQVFLRIQLLIFVVLAVLIVISTTFILWLYRHGWLPLSPIGLIILLILVYTAIQQVDNLWLRPQYMGQALKLHPGIALISLLAALALTGVLGAFIIIPVLASCKVIFQFLVYHQTDQLAPSPSTLQENPPPPELIPTSSEQSLPDGRDA